MKNIVYIKLFLALGIILVSTPISLQGDIPRFLTCDNAWGNDELWINLAFPGRYDYTFCRDEERGGEAMFLNGKLMTLLADGLVWKDVECGRHGSCTPGIINEIVIELNYLGEDFEDELGLGQYQKYDTDINVQSYLDENYILLSAVLDGDEWKFFLVTKTDGTNVSGVDHKGNDITASMKKLSGLSGWQVLPREEQLNFLQ